MKLHSIVRFGLVLFSVAILVACGQKKEIGGEIVKAYLQAVVSGDSDRMLTLSCSDFEEDAILELDSFQGVKASLNNVACEQTGSDGDIILVKCTGKILATYGNELQEFDLSSQTYRVAQEGQEWVVCGRE
ncbi:MAG: hypothetical protein HPY59_06495 [Anaerolineae bacterium]|nr:hypothetical protein [Anaerolineae bacterium]